MICASCGGEIRKNERCSGCGIEYKEMISDIHHDELKRLLERMDEMDSRHESLDLEESLLACELANSHFLVPVEVKDGGMLVGTLKTPDGRDYIKIYTDLEEYDRAGSSMEPVSNPFRLLLALLPEDCGGFIINSASCACSVTRNYLDDFFGDDRDE